MAAEALALAERASADPAKVLALAERASADPAKVRRASQGGCAPSRILDVPGQRVIDGAFIPGGTLYDPLIATGGGTLDHSGRCTVVDV